VGGARVVAPRRREPIGDRRARHRAAVAAERIVALLIGRDEQDLPSHGRTITLLALSMQESSRDASALEEELERPPHDAVARRTGQELGAARPRERAAD